MNSQFFKPRYSGLIVLTIVLLALIFGCQISPRRVVVPGPSPTPTPNGSPTPTPTPGFTPTPTATPIPTGTPSPFGKTVPRAQQFLFLGDAGSPLLTGYKINADGSLAPVPGSPFPINAPARSLKSLNNTLIVATEGTMTVYSVDKENGSLQSMGSGGMPSMDLSAPSANAGPQTAVLDADARLMFVLDVNRAELLAYRVKNGKLSAFPPQTYPLPVGTTSIALVKP